MTIVLAIRSALFYLGYSLLTVFFSVTGMLFFSRASLLKRELYLGNWNFSVMWWLRVTCGVRVEIIGEDNLPPGPCVILAKHQSQWETFYLQVMKRPVVTVLKKELLKVPFFGWGLALMEPIGIDRSDPKKALRFIQEEGQRRLQKGQSVIVFPEGTRTPPGQVGNYARSGAELAIRAQVPIVPVAHNAGHCWPAKKFLKYPGTIRMIIGAPIDTANGNSRELTEQVKTWIESEQQRLEAARRA
jgi:1-acyl-sn-glycerol-3-phosphate acyltransferase